MKGIIPAGPDVYLAHYEDPSLLAEAGRELLYGDPAIQAAVIDFGDGLTYDQAQKITLAELAEDYPQFNKLDAVVHEWAADNAPGYKVDPLDCLIKSTGVGLHFDDDWQHQGGNQLTSDPFIFSWRLNQPSASQDRTFYAARTLAQPTMLAPDGSFMHDTQAQLSRQVENRLAEPVPMIAIDHIVGRMVLFSNTTLHAVEQKKAYGIYSLLGRWGIRRLTP